MADLSVRGGLEGKRESKSTSDEGNRAKYQKFINLGRNSFVPFLQLVLKFESLSKS